MRTVHRGPLLGSACLLALLCALAAGVGLTPVGWVVGVLAGVVLASALNRGLTAVGAAGLGPADHVTLARAVLTCGAAALVAQSPHGAARGLLVAVATFALLLDNLDGRVARRTGTSSALGARFDMEVDASLIMVLSVDVARAVGAWVLLIGAARYAFVVAGRLTPWLRAGLPDRYWRKVVAAVQGVVLTMVVTRWLPMTAAVVVLLCSLALLAESFGRDVWWLWRRRDLPPEPVDAPIPKDAAAGEMTHG